MQKKYCFSTIVENMINKNRTLKISILLIAFALFNLHASSYSQNKRITLNVADEPIESVLKEIEGKSDYKFFFKTAEIDVKREVSINVTKKTIADILQMMFSDGTVEFSVVKNQIVLKKRRIKPRLQQEARVEETPLAPVQQSVSGTIVDNQGTPIPGASVLEKGTTNGVAADFDGNYSITVSGPNAVLVFRSIGFATQEATVGSKTSIDITLLEDAQSLDEVVIMGYASQSKSDLTGSVATVGGDDIRELPATSVAQTLQGRVAGVQVVTDSGEPGIGSDIVIRGGGSVNGMPPLFIVDGVRMGTDYSFNNQDIESIEILKDASAAAIYGAQAAGGVVLIQTKRGQSARGLDKVNVNVNGYFGLREVFNLIPLMNTQQFFTAREAFGFNTSAWGDPSQLPDTDWNDVMYNTGSDQNYTVSLTGASDKSNFYVSGNYFRQDGVRIDNSFERYALRVNSDFNLGKKFKVGETVYLYKSMNDPVPTGGNGYPTLFRTVPSMSVRDENGDWGKAPDGGYYNGRNPAQRAYGRIDKVVETAMEGNVYVDYKFFDGLNLRATMGASIGSMNNTEFLEAYDTGAQSAPAEMTKIYTDWENYTANLVLTFDKTYDVHNIKALAGYEVYKEDASTIQGYAAEFAVDNTESFDLNTNLATQRLSGGILPNLRLVSQFGRVNYSYDNKYLFSATVRRDGADRFGPENKWGVFPAYSLGWRVSEEPFFENVDFVSSLKLRASYGALGNFGSIPQYLYQTSYGPQNITALADGTRVQAYGRNLSLPNEGIKWEEVKTTDIGVDASFLDGSLLLTADWYVRNTEDMIYAVPVPLSAGYNGNPVFTNIGELRNTGLEFLVNYRKSFGDFGMDLSVNGAFNENEVISLDGTGTQAINSGFGGQYLSNQITRTTAGEPISQFYGYVVDGIFETDAEANNRGVTQSGAGAGDLIYRDVNGDGTISEEDRDFIGNPWPKLTYGFNFKFDYKGVDLSLQFQGVHDMDVYNATKHYSDFLAGDYNASPNVFGASFFNGNGLTNQPRLGYFANDGSYIRDPNANYTKISSYFVEDASYLKLRNIQLGYNFSEDLVSSLGIRSARIYLQAQNLFTLTNYSGQDPEVLGEGITARGIDRNNSYPQTRFVSLGLNLDF